LHYTVTSLAANDGIISIKAQRDIVVNSVIAPNGGVSILIENGSIYAGNAGDHGEYGLNTSLHPLENPNGLFSGIGLGVNSFNLSISGTNTVPCPHIIAGGYTYLSATHGTIGVGHAGLAKDPNIGVQIIGTVRPGVTSQAGVYPAPDVISGAPVGIIDYDDSSLFGNPDIGPQSDDTGNKIISSPGGSLPSLDNQLGVFIEAFGGAKSALPSGMTSAAGLLIGIVPPVVVPPAIIPPIIVTPPAVNPVINAIGLNGVPPVINTLLPNRTVYYEILNPHLVRDIEVVPPSTIYAYHPLVETDNSAFDNIKLEPEAYDYIDGHINLNNPLVLSIQAGDQRKK
jgi:hypothetical protein